MNAVLTLVLVLTPLLSGVAVTQNAASDSPNTSAHPQPAALRPLRCEQMAGVWRGQQTLLNGQITRWISRSDHNGKLVIDFLNADGSPDHRLQGHWQCDASSQRMNTVTTNSDGETRYYSYRILELNSERFIYQFMQGDLPGVVFFSSRVHSF
ncbi:hypothetical protein [Oceanobacter mangrovi]|uniref:hypothetical protein n=1 Tax=Oceanobacter mangrovi TaxID=2862510 RepID=UPI001C8E6FC5|nr:hypothetical protein [Oceanobacter mangrovi]